MKMKWSFILVLAVILTGCDELSQSYSLKDLGNLDLFDQYLAEKNLVVTKYFEGSEDKTTDYDGYSFLFKSTGSLFAILNNDTVSGSWTIFEKDSLPKMNIYFPEAQSPLDELNEDWLLVLQQEDKIELKDISSEGTFDLLTFEQQ